MAPSVDLAEVSHSTGLGSSATHQTCCIVTRFFAEEIISFRWIALRGVPQTKAIYCVVSVLPSPVCQSFS